MIAKTLPKAAVALATLALIGCAEKKKSPGETLVAPDQVVAKPVSEQTVTEPPPEPSASVERTQVPETGSQWL